MQAIVARIVAAHRSQDAVLIDQVRSRNGASAFGTDESQVSDEDDLIVAAAESQGEQRADGSSSTPRGYQKPAMKWP